MSTSFGASPNVMVGSSGCLSKVTFGQMGYFPKKVTTTVSDSDHISQNQTAFSANPVTDGNKNHFQKYFFYLPLVYLIVETFLNPNFYEKVHFTAKFIYVISYVSK